VGTLERLAERLITAQSVQVFAIATGVIRERSPSRVFIINGRFAQQQACLLAAQRLKVDITFLELNRFFSGGLFSRSYRIQDRLATQMHARDISKDISQANLRESVERWESDRRAKNSSTNPFNKLWVDSKSSWDLPRKGLALFATSSRDEYDALDLEWKESSWETQLDSFHAIWGEIKSSDLTPVLRVHPNLLNKHLMSGLREIAETKKFMRNNPDFIVVWPSSRASTYDLISYADVVVVLNSTVGLEASVQGIPVICTGSAGYDLVADVYRIHGPLDLPKLKLPLASDKSGAEIFVAAQAALDEPVEPNKSGVEIDKHSRFRLLILSVLDGSLTSILFELRWKSSRRIALKLFPR
jgi:hypothetical protein